jgi:hypothetical protein
MVLTSRHCSDLTFLFSIYSACYFLGEDREEEVVVLYSRHCSGSIEWARYRSFIANVIKIKFVDFLLNFFMNTYLYEFFCFKPLAEVFCRDLQGFLTVKCL